ncbi:MAG: rhomboid family intramembrane serine protease [Marinifilaceae bacterium]|jgi:membrane associated rhomboid family serine protease|nr:rhomboid family intramembrane serine protease [Marinifilaceae bacterium]
MTYIIIIITGLISYLGFQNSELIRKSIFNSYLIVHKKEYFRLISHGFIHSNWNHLIFNLITLWFFGTALESYFDRIIGAKANLYFIFLYVSAIVVSSIVDLIKYKNNSYYNALGASGATSAIVFACIFFAPYQKIYFMYVLPIPGIIFGIAYLAYSYYMNKKNIDNIGHSAHFCGAVYGFLFPILIDPKLINLFLHNLLNF